MNDTIKRNTYTVDTETEFLLLKLGLNKKYPGVFLE